MICAALVTAGGIGKRMGSSIPKQYLDLHGVPILARTIMVFIGHPLIDRIVVTVPPGDEDFCRQNVTALLKADKHVEIVSGGVTRQGSVFNGLQHLGGSDVVTIHDGVRPLVRQDIVTRTITAALECGAALAAVRIKETVKRKTDRFLETIPRADLWLAHTPQTFRTALIVEAHTRAVSEGFEGTDDAALVERMGHPVQLVEDSEDNIKITTARDLDLARMLFKRSLGSQEYGTVSK
jgi:2-C-methyl-D-erythritol 4-phosphate cytidylyltransferase